MKIKRTRQLAFCCILCLLVAALAFVRNNDAYAKDAQTDQVVFFSIPIGVEVAPVFASPTRDSYQTGLILKDRYVEVYFRNKDGFCAIRPPQGSFSWINGKFVELADNSSGKIVSPSRKAIPSRVGGDSPSSSSVVQVGLQHGQKVKILGKVGLSDGSTWYKIAPPPGEFRWIELKSLTQDEALAHLPSKLIFQSEYLKQFKDAQNSSDKAPNSRQGEANNSLGLTLPAFDKDNSPAQESIGAGFAGENNPKSNAQNNEIDPSAFKVEVSKLNADVFQALQKKPVSQEDLQILQLRTEALFDAAPTDDERYQLQSVYDILKKTEKAAFNVQNYSINNSDPVFNEPPAYQGQMETLQNIEQQPTEFQGSAFTEGTFTPNKQSYPHFTTPNFQTGINGSNVQWVQAIDENGHTQILPIDQNGNVLSQDQLSSFGTMAGQNGSGIVGSLPPSYSSSNPSSPSKGKSKKTTFAFSNGNSPFGSKSRGARVVSGDVSQQTNPSLSRLPSLFPTPQTIVPPQDYNVGIPLSQTRQNSRLVAQAQNKAVKKEHNTDNVKTAQTETLVTSTEAKKERKPQGTLVFQAPQFSEVLSGDSEENNKAIAPASSETKKASGGESANKIRQTGSFTPVTVRSKDGFDAKGTLIAVSSPGDGAPKYGLLDATGGSLNINAYLESSKGVILEKFVGKKVGVKGNVGAVSVDGQLYKLVIVSSVFPL